MKRFIFLILILSSILAAQPQRQDQPRQQSRKVLYSEIIIFAESDSICRIYYTYRIPYRRLVFEREGNGYTANFRVQIELTDTLSNVIERDFNDRKVVVDNFELTNEATIYLQSFLRFKLPNGTYYLQPVITDLNSQNELKLEQIRINTADMEENSFYSPLVLNSNKILCDDQESFVLTNFGGNIPFSPESYDLLIPVKDTNVEELDIKIINNSDTVIVTSISESFLMPASISGCDGNLILSQADDLKEIRNFIIRDINSKMVEGYGKIIVSIPGTEVEEDYSLNIGWNNKPISLRNPEMAIEMLQFIEPDSVIYSMLDEEEENYSKILNDYWSEHDPTPGTSFNPLMNEYYSRVDYAMMEFQGIGKNNGAKTDRGRIYVRFGKPGRIERSSDFQGNVVETWIYSTPGRKFVFIDKRGTGNFTLIDG